MEPATAIASVRAVRPGAIETSERKVSASAYRTITGRRHGRKLYRHGKFLPGKCLLRPETGPRFLAATAYFARQRPASLAFPSPKAREVKDYSPDAGKPDLRKTAWWRMQS